MDKAYIYAVALGALLGLLYDFFRLVRLCINFSFFIDFLFWLISAFAVFSYLLIFNNGSIRLLYFMLIFAGAVLYLTTLGRVTVRAEYAISKKVKMRLKKFKKVLQFIYNIYYNIKVKIKGVIKAFLKGAKYDKGNCKKE